MNSTNKDKIDDAQLDAELKTLPETLMPSRDLWSGIDLAIENYESEKEQRLTKKNSYASYYMASAAAVCLVAVLSWNWLMPNSSDVQVAQNALSFSQELTNSFEQQKSILLTSYQETDALTENWKEQVSDLDKAAKVIRDALESDPNNQQLIYMLQGIYQQQIDLINRTHGKKELLQQI